LEEDRDRIAVLNIEKRGLELLNLSGGPLTAPTAPQMTDVTPNRCGEPNRPSGRGGGQISPLWGFNPWPANYPYQFQDSGYENVVSSYQICVENLFQLFAFEQSSFNPFPAAISVHSPATSWIQSCIAASASLRLLTRLSTLITENLALQNWMRSLNK
jgi:hypothetical protein